MENKMIKLYVWISFCPDNTDGLAFALASNLKEAKELVIKAYAMTPHDWGELHIINIHKKCGYAV